MTCEEFIRLMDEDGPVTAGEAGAHLASCAACEEAYGRWQAIRQGFKSLKEEPPPPFLHTRVMAHVRTAAPAPKPWAFFTWSRVPWAGPLLAAALLVLLGGVGLVSFLDTAKRSSEQARAERDLEGRKLKEGLPPMPEPSEKALDDQYTEILDKAGEDTAGGDRERAKEPLKREEAPLVFSGLKKQADEALREQDAATAGNEPEDVAAPAAPALSSAAPGSPPHASKAGPAPAPPASKAGAATGAAGAPPPRDSAAALQERAPSEAYAPEPAAVQSERKDEKGGASERQYQTQAARITVACTLQPLEDGRARRIDLVSAVAPARGVTWTLAVGADGSIAFAEPGLEFPQPLAKALAPLRLPPGRYALRRAD